MEPPLPPPKRRPQGISPAKPPLRRPRDRRIKAQKDESYRQSALLQAQQREPEIGNESVTIPRRPSQHQHTQSAPIHVEQHDRTVRHFHVASVGAGGTLYLKPTRVTPQPLANPQMTPPATADGLNAARIRSPTIRASDASGALTLRFDPGQPQIPDLTITTPPSSLKNRRKDSISRPTRSHSFSDVSERSLARTAAARDLDKSSAAADRPQRRRSFTDSSPGLLDISVPHYRLGTPRFSAQGTAYLHYSTYTASSDGVRSSVLSGSDHGYRFPPPPGRNMPSFVSQQPFMLPNLAQSITASSSSTVSPSVAGNASAVSKVGALSPSLFDKLEATIDDPAFVRYHPSTGRIIAATPARLIAQITSPAFLDYELLADFFLTFRCFMPCHDVLEYLVARMQWAFSNASDAGRIVRVRTFVALRHWILNYFADDFKPDSLLRRRFCDLVNALTRFLIRQRPEQGSDLKILGELKKCWQRTCALHWPVPDSMTPAPGADIVPGGEPAPPILAGPSALSLPLTIRPTTRSDSIFEMAPVVLPGVPGSPGQPPSLQIPRTPTMDAFGPNRPLAVRVPSSIHSANIPASPMSEQSLEVLSCSVPFLRNMRSQPIAREREKAATAISANAQRHDQSKFPPSSMTNTGARHGHKRSGSFSDALRDQRAPLPTTMGDGIELEDLPSFAFTGGLVRGILLQPSPAKINVMRAPDVTGQDSRNRSGTYPGGGSVQVPPSGDRPPHAHAVRKIVGDMRRAIGSRKAAESPSRGHKAANSVDTRTTGSSALLMDKQSPPRWQRPLDPPQLDLLAAKVENSYHYATESSHNSSHRPNKPLDPEAEGPLNSHQSYVSAPVNAAEPTANPNSFISTDDVFAPKESGRLDSHITAGSQSILIMDATGSPSILQAPDETLASFSPVTQVDSFQNDDEARPDFQSFKFSLEPVGSVGDENGSPWQQSWDARLQDLGIRPEEWESRNASRVMSQDFQARKSSFVQPAPLAMPSMQHQLRRRPGGDLKATDHVHELGMSALRPHSAGTFSDATHSYRTSYLGSRNASGMPYAHHHSGSLQLSRTAPANRMGSTSFFNSVSTHPHVRPSFEVEANRLKNLSSAVSEGGIEDALLKLEGKIPSPSQSNFSGSAQDPENNQDMQAMEDEIQIMMESGDGDAAAASELVGDVPTPPQEARYTGSMATESARPSVGYGLSPVNTETQGASIYQLSDSYAGSVQSRSNWPLPNLSASQLAIPARSSKATSSRRSIPTMTARITRYPIPNPYNPVSETTSVSLVSDTDIADARVLLAGSQLRESGSNTDAYFADDPDALSDISTEIADPPEDDHGVRSFLFDDTVEESPHSIQPFRGPTPTHPSTTEPTTDPPSDRRSFAARAAAASTTDSIGVARALSPPPQQRTSLFPALTGPGIAATANYPLIQPSFVHTPFVLAFESEVIAEQLTIIEKDALDEVDWKDLISLHWQQHPPAVQNWVDFLQRDTPNGIDIVIARFNIVVKWVVSEILLTDTPTERARTITKFIHIACHARKLRNFASVYQITLALLSSDLALLHLTWGRVTPRDRQMLQQLETLCQPLRNFHNLRAEMETALPDTACIPFIGLYTHDLMLNGQKSAYIGTNNGNGNSNSRLPSAASNYRFPPTSTIPNGTAPAVEGSASQPPVPPSVLVNFERFQTAAAIVKSLLRLIEASAKFVFRPHPEALSRCLWLAALEEPEIAARAKLLERGAPVAGVRMGPAVG